MTVSTLNSRGLKDDRIDPWTRGVVNNNDICAKVYPASKRFSCMRTTGSDSLDFDYLADVYADGGLITVDSRGLVGAVWRAGDRESSQSRLQVEEAMQSRLQVEEVLPQTNLVHPVPEVWAEETDMPAYVESKEFPRRPTSIEAVPRALSVEKRGGYGDEFHEFPSSDVSTEIPASSAGTGSEPDN